MILVSDLNNFPETETINENFKYLKIMAKKNSKTECSGMSWGDFLLLTDTLKKNQEFRLLLFVSIGCYCGLRASDILGLRWINILNTSEIIMEEKKTGKTRKIILNESLKDIIKLSYEKLILSSSNVTHQKCNVFANKAGNPISIQFINRGLHKIFKTYKIKVQNPSSHTFRKTFGKRIYEMNEKSEASLVLLSHIFNHSSTSVTRKYIGINQEQIQDVYLSL